MAQKKRAPRKAPPPPPVEEEKGEGASGNVETVCVAMDARQRERLAALMKKEPSWGRTQCVRYLMGIVERLEEQLAETPAIEAYAVQQHLTLPAARRKVQDWEWIVDAVVMLARERLAQLEARGKLPGQQ